MDEYQIKIKEIREVIVTRTGRDRQEALEKAWDDYEDGYIMLDMCDVKTEIENVY